MALEEPAEKGNDAGERLLVRCCSCTHAFEVSSARRLAVCPACGQRMGTGTLRLMHDFTGGALCTAGEVQVGPRAAVVTSVLSASGGVDIAGAVEASIRSLGLVRVRSTGWVRGSIRARRLVIDPGARVEDALMEVWTPSLDISDVLEKRAASSESVG